ncbi:hypothetical protein F5Y04DRAFT_265019 [Hypomontagnella monticulosa]|nr:hypothetical protein F5Y04DRAFT_265019 [Hypomontagnella monticulosa]
MIMMVPTAPIQLIALVLATGSLATSNTELSEGFGPTLGSARENGPQIFNAVHNAMREFGSALNHNGMSLFPGIIPEGVLLYHGRFTKEEPELFDWLAFEIEHAESFARGGWRYPPNRTLSIPLQDEQRPPIFAPKSGYLHVYQADRPLNVLYIDGTAAGKTDMGTVDTQDYLLAVNRSRDSWNDWQRAKGLCELAQEWNIDGFIRMEPGFEVIYCNFTDGLRPVSTYQQPDMDDLGRVNDSRIAMFEWVKAAAQRYNGIGSSRVVLDYSSMVSAFFYPLNLTNPDPKRPELPRLVDASDDEMRVVREHVANSMARSIASKNAPLDWQGVTDMITTRYAQRLPFISRSNSINVIRNEVNNLLNVYIDYSDTDDGLSSAQKRCAQFYLQPTRVRTPEDELIYAAIEATATTICTALFEVRRLVIEDTEIDETSAIDATRNIISDLMDTLRWPEWKECGPCQPDEVCFVAMWPFGDVEDHFNPSCRNFWSILGRHNYWKDPGRTPGHGPPPPPPPSLCENEQSCGEQEYLKNEEL